MRGRINKKIYKMQKAFDERIMLIQASNILDIVRCMNADVLDSGRHTSIEN